MAKSGSKKRKVLVESHGEAHIVASFNNIIISLTNKNGDVISWSSAGKMGFKGTKKNTPYAALPLYHKTYLRSLRLPLELR